MWTIILCDFNSSMNNTNDWYHNCFIECVDVSFDSNFFNMFKISDKTLKTMKKTLSKDIIFLDNKDRSISKLTVLKTMSKKIPSTASTVKNNVQIRNKLNDKPSKNVASRRKTSIVDGNLHGIDINTERKSLKESFGRRASVPTSMKNVTGHPVISNKTTSIPSTNENMSKLKTAKNKYDNVKSRLGVTKPSSMKQSNNTKTIDNKLKSSPSKLSMTGLPKTTQNLSRKLTGTPSGVVNRRASIAVVPSATSRLPAGGMSSRGSSASQQMSGEYK